MTYHILYKTALVAVIAVPLFSLSAPAKAEGTEGATETHQEHKEGAPPHVDGDHPPPPPPCGKEGDTPPPPPPPADGKSPPEGAPPPPPPPCGEDKDDAHKDGEHKGPPPEGAKHDDKAPPAAHDMQEKPAE